MKRQRQLIGSVTLCAMLLALAAHTTNAFYAFKRINIDQGELASPSPCSIVTCQQLIAYECAESFKIFLISANSSLEASLIYSTTKAVTQVKPSKLTNEAFISFIEARTESDAKPATYAYLRVVDATGLRDQGISTTFIPNRSIFLGDGLVLKVNEAQTNMQAYNLATKSASTIINILNTQLTFDLYPFGALPQQWVIAACQKQNQYDRCNFYALKGTYIIPYAQNTIGEQCSKRIEVSSNYLMLACEDVKSLSVYKFDRSHIMSRVLYLPGIERNDARMMTFSEELSVILFTKTYPWIAGQTQPLTFIDSVALLKLAQLAEPIVIKFEKDFFYEEHANQSASMSYLDHIMGQHESPNLSYNYSQLIKFSVSNPQQFIATTTSNGSGTDYSLHLVQYCGINAVHVPDNQNCYAAPAGEFIDWVKMAKHGLIQSTKCDTQDSLFNLQKILRAQACQGYLVSASLGAEEFVVQKKHLELDSVQCSTDKRAIGGHCISCGKLCRDCFLPNTNGLIYGFYLDGLDLQGTCQACASNTILSQQQIKGDWNSCTCQENFYYDSNIDSCQKCSENCAECNSFEQCNKCSDLHVVASDGTCRYKVCLDGSFLNKLSGQCDPCHETCNTCSIDGSKCLTCPIEYTRGDTICLKCAQRETIEGDKCISCGPSCMECSTKDICKTCQAGASLSNGICTCDDGYFLDSITSMCKRCGATCATCEDDSACKTCLSGYELGQTKCHQCAKNQYFASSSDSCVQCGLNCIECQNGPNKCKSCAEGSVLNSDGTCSCETGSYLDLSVGACAKCQASCEKCLGPEKCETCPAGFELGDSICLSCASNAYIQGDECKQCGSACLACKASGPLNHQCSQCVVNSGLRLDGTCECLTGFFYSSITNECAKCAKSCSICENENTCLTCQPGYEKGISGLCECAAGTFFDTFTNSCMSCDDSCATCDSTGLRCLTCPLGSTLGNKKCLACQSNEYATKIDICENCGFQCDRCDSGPNKCKQCASGTQLQSDIGKCICDDGRYFDELIQACVKCHSSCETCLSSQKCTTCPLDTVLGASICLSCASNEFLSGDQCKSCGANCQNCDSEKSCKNCKPGFYLQQDGSCQEETLIVCAANEYNENNLCNQCSVNCNRCSGPDLCLECDNLTATMQQSGNCICKNGFFADVAAGGKCIKCDNDCLTCSNKGSCNSCSIPAVLGKNRCLECPASTFVENDNCFPCSIRFPYCDKCETQLLTGQLTCSKCQEGLSLASFNGKCSCSDEASYLDDFAKKCIKCPQNCSKCTSATQCTVCKNILDRVGQNGQCEAIKCGTGSLLDITSGKCLNCDQNCAACESNPTQCTSCMNPSMQILAYDNTCVTCNLGVEPFDSKSCICSQGQYFEQLRKQCSTCKTLSCLVCDTNGIDCLSCQSDYMLDETQKSCNCPARGFFQNKDRSSCQACSLGCNSCMDESGICSNCLPGYFKNEVSDSFKSDAFTTTCIACPQGCSDCTDIIKCKACAASFQLGQDNVCRCPRGKFFESAVNACVTCTLQHCENCFDRNTCIDCSLGYKSILDGQVCKKVTSDIAEFQSNQDDQKDTTDLQLNVTQFDPIDEETMMYKTLAISVGVVVVLFICPAICFLCYRAKRNNNKWKKRVVDVPKSQEPSYIDQQELSPQDDNPQLSKRKERRGSPILYVQRTTNAENSLISSLSNREESHRGIPIVMPKYHHLERGLLNLNSEIGEESKEVSEIDQVEGHGITKGQSPFENSPVRSELSSELNSKQRQDKNLIDMAMTIMVDCEIEMTAEAKQQMNTLAGDSNAFQQSQVLEKIIRIMARTVKDQVEQENTNAEDDISDKLNRPSTAGRLSMMKSLSAQRSISRLIGTPISANRRISTAINQRQIEHNIAERFDELSRGNGDMLEIEEGIIKKPHYFLSRKNSVSHQNKEADDYNSKYQKVSTPISEQFDINDNSDRFNISSAQKEKQMLAGQSGIIEMQSKQKSSANSTILNINDMGAKKGRESMPPGRFSGINSGILASAQKCGNHSLQHNTSVRSFKLADPIIDEDTYRVFVNKNDAAISTQKALNNRLEKLSSSEIRDSVERKSQGESSASYIQKFVKAYFVKSNVDDATSDKRAKANDVQFSHEKMLKKESSSFALAVDYSKPYEGNTDKNSSSFINNKMHRASAPINLPSVDSKDEAHEHLSYVSKHSSQRASQQKTSIVQEQTQQQTPNLSIAVSTSIGKTMKSSIVTDKTQDTPYLVHEQNKNQRAPKKSNSQSIVADGKTICSKNEMITLEGEELKQQIVRKESSIETNPYQSDNEDQQIQKKSEFRIGDKLLGGNENSRYCKPSVPKKKLGKHNQVQSDFIIQTIDLANTHNNQRVNVSQVRARRQAAHKVLNTDQLIADSYKPFNFTSKEASRRRSISKSIDSPPKTLGIKEKLYNSEIPTYIKPVGFKVKKKNKLK